MPANLHQKQKGPNNPIQKWLASLINMTMGLSPGGGAAMVTAVAAATGIESLKSAITGLGTHLKYTDQKRHLAEALQNAYDMGLFGATPGASDTAIAALTTINTVAAATDLLYLTCTSYDATLTSSTYGSYATIGRS